MKKNILIVSHNFHAFLLNEIQFAADTFSSVVVVTQYSAQIEEKFKNRSNVTLDFFSIHKLYASVVRSLPDFFRKDVRNELAMAHNGKKLNWKYLKILAYTLGLKRVLQFKIKRYICKDNATDWALLSSWYSGDAYVIAQMKEQYPVLETVSLAHSFEVDKTRNNYIDYLFRYDYKNYIDWTSFISKNVLQTFLEEHTEKLRLDHRKFGVRYLGTKKLLEGANPGNPETDVIEVLSCSNAVPVKRLDLLFEGLNCITDYKVNWTHIGSGPELEKLMDRVHQEKTDTLIVQFLGSKDNAAVHDFLRHQNLDVFINTSSSEGIPVSIMEALAYGIPAIATDVGGNSEIVNSSCGVLIAPNPTPGEIAQAVVSIKKCTADQKRLLSTNAQKIFHEAFDADIIRPQFYHNIRDEELAKEANCGCICN